MNNLKILLNSNKRLILNSKNNILLNIKSFSSTSTVNPPSKFQFYQRIFPSVKLLADKLNVKIPKDVKYITKELIISLSTDSNSNNNSNNANNNNISSSKLEKNSIEEAKDSNNNTQSSNSIKSSNSLIHANMQTECNLNNIIEELNLKIDNENKFINKDDLSKFENFIKKVVKVSLNKSKIKGLDSKINVKYYPDLDLCTSRVSTEHLINLTIGGIKNTLGYENNYIIEDDNNNNEEEESSIFDDIDYSKEFLYNKDLLKINKTSKINLTYSCEHTLEEQAAEMLSHIASIIENPLLINV